MQNYEALCQLLDCGADLHYLKLRFQNSTAALSNANLTDLPGWGEIGFRSGQRINHWSRDLGQMLPELLPPETRRELTQMLSLYSTLPNYTDSQAKAPSEEEHSLWRRTFFARRTPLHWKTNLRNQVSCRVIVAKNSLKNNLKGQLQK